MANSLEHTDPPSSLSLVAGQGGHTSGMERITQHADWALLAQLSLQLTARIPITGYKVKDLLALRVGQILPSLWPSTTDVPLLIGSVQLGWSEFEVVDQKMAVRLTRLA